MYSLMLQKTLTWSLREFNMKTITLTDEQFDTLFEYTKVLTIDGEFEDLYEVHDILEDIKFEGV